ARPAVRRAERDRLRGLPAAGHLLRHCRRQAAGLLRRRGVLSHAAGPRRGGRHPHRHLLRSPRSGPQPRPLRLLQAARGADRGPAPALPPDQVLIRIRPGTILTERTARLRAREVDARKDWAEKASTDIARRFDIIRVEDLRIRSMTRSAKGTAGAPGQNVRRKAGLNREILRSGWGLLARRLEDKAPGRVE